MVMATWREYELMVLDWVVVWFVQVPEVQLVGLKAAGAQWSVVVSRE